MPRFSICISSFNDADYLCDCVDSVLSQSFSDFELVIVNDKSTDNTAEIIDRYICADPRVISLTNSTNLGVHLGRKTAVSRSSGDYILFLDSDDELLDGSLEALDEALAKTPCDVLHFGIKVENAGVSATEALNFEAYINRPLETLDGIEACEACYSSSRGYLQDWRTTQRVYRGDFLRSTFNSMTDLRIDRAEDAYETFVILSNSRSQITRNDIKVLKYFYGRGVNSGSSLSVSGFFESASGFYGALNHLEEYASSTRQDCLLSFAADAKDKLYELLFNDWLNRVDTKFKISAAEKTVSLLGKNEVATELMRLSRDSFYESLHSSSLHFDNLPALDWFDYSLGLVSNPYVAGSRFLTFYLAAVEHLDCLKDLDRLSKMETKSVRIFVSTHKNVDLFDSLIFQPVQVGCELRDDAFPWAFHDNDGENISSLNAMYCELTTQYWAWKNTTSDFVGFCHYRRYFDFSPVRHTENEYGEIIDDRIDDEAFTKYCLDDETVENFVKRFDVITTEEKDIRSYLGKNATLRTQYDSAEKLFVEDLDLVISILKERHPDYSSDADKFLSGHFGRFCNMFVMKRSIFNDYCEWLFPILEEFCSKKNMNLYSKEALRTPGHLAERLLNIFLIHFERVNEDCKLAQVQCVHFTDTARHSDLQPLLGLSLNKPVIPIVFASDNNYVPMLTTTIYSTIKNASKSYFYDVIVLNKDISNDNQTLMSDFFKRFDNVNIRFYNVSSIIQQYDLTTNNNHISIETYYRFLIQKILSFYDKVLYLDSDLIVEGDISELFNTELNDNLLAAAHDIDYLGNLNMKDGKRLKYSNDILKMRNPYSYFQAGVLVLNTKAMREYCSIEQWLGYASDSRYIYNDQDVLNACCEGRITWLDFSWNVMTNCADRINRVFSFAPAIYFDKFLESRKSPKIVHYAGFEKPWKFADCDQSELYWFYARDTPFYEKLLALLAGSGARSNSTLPLHERAISIDNPIRRVMDPIAPVGSARREVLKSIGRLLTHRN